MVKYLVNRSELLFFFFTNSVIIIVLVFFHFAKRVLVPKRYRDVCLTNVPNLKNSSSNTQYSSCFGN